MSENKNLTAPSALVLDVCCGPRSMWFNKKDTRAVFVDCRKGNCTMDACNESLARADPDPSRSLSSANSGGPLGCLLFNHNRKT